MTKFVGVGRVACAGVLFAVLMVAACGSSDNVTRTTTEHTSYPVNTGATDTTVTTTRQSGP